MGEERREHHSISVEDRKRVRISGVTEVLSFDEESIAVETECGLLILKGTELHVGKLNLEDGEVSVSGHVDSVTYAEDADGNKNSFFGRLFR